MAESPKSQQKPTASVVGPIEDRHFPSLFQSADQTSLSAQRLYLRLQKSHLGFLIVGSLVAAFAAIVPTVAVTWFYTSLAITLVIGVILTWVTHSRRDDKVWFDCRAIAESTKTATWRYMMKAAPLEGDDSAKNQFVAELREIREARPSSPRDLAKSLDGTAQSISDFMNDVRTKPFEERKAFYLESRLRDQKGWYAKKANLNSCGESHWFWITTGLQCFAAVLAIVEAASGGFQIAVVPILMTCAAAAVAWNQMKRHSELAQTYSLAAQELGEQEAIALDITDESQFFAIVEQVEETISREHTMWCARRDTVIRTSKKGK